MDGGGLEGVGAWAVGVFHVFKIFPLEQYVYVYIYIYIYVYNIQSLTVDHRLDADQRV